MLTRDQMVRHADDWIAAWNRRDLHAVLKAFAPDATFRSPTALTLTGSSFLEGREAISAYWSLAIARLNKLNFTLIDVVCDTVEQSMMVLYEAELDCPPRRACEIFKFRDGKKSSGEALYGE